MTPNGKPMHEIEVTHRFIEISRAEENNVSFESVEKCQDCGGQSKTLHLTATDEANLEDSVSIESISTKFEQINKQLKKIWERFEAELSSGTKYNTLEELVNTIDKRYDGAIWASELSYRQLDRWSKTATRRFQSKVLLWYKQGPVCNRCDFIYEFDDLDVDHVCLVRSRGQLTNLQLLRRRCHDRKGKSPPCEKDISPFKYEGKPCMHRLTCKEIAQLSGGDE